MKKFLISLVVALISVFGFLSATTTNVYADDGCEPGATVFFALKPWYAGWTDGECNIKAPGKGEIPKFVWSIVLNLMYDVAVLVGYVAVIMVAYGGYMYMFSRGDVGRVERGKKTLIAAITGLIIAMLASVIMNTISTILISS